MNPIKKSFLIVILCSVLISCQTVTISDSRFKSSRAPAYEETQWFFLWGLVPSVRNINVESICRGAGASQLQTQDSFFNQFLKVVTLGIVYPRKAKVWCR